MKKVVAAPLFCALCIVAAVVALEPGLSSWFVADDFYHLGFISSVPHPWHSWTHPEFGRLLFRPVPYTLGFYLDGLLGMDPRRMHLAGLCIHCLNVVLVFAFIYLLFRPRPLDERAAATAEKSGAAFRESSPLLPAFIAALLFAVHPISVLTANWYACRADIIGFLFAAFTLAIVAGKDRPTKASLIGSGGLALLALLSKVTFVPLFMAGFLVSLTRNSRIGRGEALKRSLTSALPLFIAFLVYYCWRYLVLGQIGGYEATPASVAELLAQARYHLPRAGESAARDFISHHLPTDHHFLGFLLVSWAGIALLGGLAALLRRSYDLFLGLALIALGLIPVWNLSHMLVFREERLLIFPLLGFLIMVAALLAGPRDKVIRGMMLVFALAAASILGLYSREKVSEWNTSSRANLELSRALSDFIALDLKKQGDRIYVIGLDSEHYYLDLMVKWTLAPSLRRREIMLGDQEGFIWISKKLKKSLSPAPELPARALPGRQPHATDPAMVFQTVTPPDLLAAAALDPGARVIEYKPGQLKDLTSELANLYENDRTRLQNMAVNHPDFLPSFSFHRTRLNFDWELSPGLKMIEPAVNDEPYLFIANNRDPYLISPEFQLSALMAGELYLELSVEQKDYLPPAQQQACLSWQSKDSPGFEPANTVCFPIQADGEVHGYEIHLDRSVRWAQAGEINRLRLDPVSFPARFKILVLEFRPL